MTTFAKTLVEAYKQGVIALSNLHSLRIGDNSFGDGPTLALIKGIMEEGILPQLSTLETDSLRRLGGFIALKEIGEGNRPQLYKQISESWYL